MPQFAQLALTYTLPFLAVLTLVITVHEFGHFIVARACGVAVDRFSIGFGRAIVSWTDKHETEWRIGWIPLGGYVKFSGQDNAASIPDADDLAELRKQVLASEGPAALRRYFDFKPLWQRALVVLAGPVANFILSVTIFAVLAMTIGEQRIKPHIGDVSPGSPAAAAGFRSGDMILQANGRPIGDFRDLQELVALHTGEQIRFIVTRGSQQISLVATPMRKTRTAGPRGCPIGMGCLGLGPGRSDADFQVVRLGPLAALGQGVHETTDIIGTSLTYIGRIVTGHESGDQLNGIVGIAGATGQQAAEVTRNARDLPAAARDLAVMLIGMSAFISAAVGFANLLPIPVLDGGHLLFYGYEAIAQRPLAANLQAAGYRVGFALLVGLMLFVTWNDLQRYQVFHLIRGLFS